MPESTKKLLPKVNGAAVKRLAVAGLLASVSAACSSDTMRFGDNPFSNPFSSQSVDTTTTGSLGTSPTMPVQSAPLGTPQQTYAAPAPAAAPASAPAANAAMDAVTGSAKGWSAQGGSPIYVGTGDTLATLSGRYNVPAAAILAANGLSNASQVVPGQKLTIPVYNPTGGAVAAAAPATVYAPAPMAAAPAPVAGHVPAAPQVAMLPPRPVARAADTPGSLNAQAAKLAGNANAAPAPRQMVASLPPVTPAAPVSAAAPAQSAAAAPASAQPAGAPAATAAKPEAVDSAAGFRWPARGRVINAFGSGNEGINIAVPEGTPVKAAEGGVVAYAGNELKGYGNLVLIRHDNGWVSAYANNGELNVKRGEKVSRGQTIAKSGQTGNVTSPQLHFELRKGSKPVDPLPHLAGL